MSEKKDNCFCCSDAHRKYKMIKCLDCENYMCKNCLDDDYYETEIIFYSLFCSSCDQVICPMCTIVCFDCANETGIAPQYCTKCAPKDITEVVCKYHTWFSCKKHKQKNCGFCKANKNYDFRHRLF